MQAHRPSLPLLAIALGATLTALTACQDTATPSDRKTILRSSSSQPAAPSSQALRDLDRIHQENPNDWVGREHNRLLREFKTRLAQPGVLTRSMCDYLMDFVTEPNGGDRRASDHASRLRREAAGVALSTTALCNRGTIAVPTSHGARTRTTEELILSAAARDLTGRVVTAVDAAYNPYELATRLAPVLKAASQLDSVERAIVEATVSVAQNSFEYWEAELPGMEDRFYSDYSGCLNQTYQAGYTEDSGRDACLDGGLAYTDYLRPAPSLSRELSLATYASRSVRGCNIGGHYKRLAGADVAGAITGAVKGAAGGWPGAAAGAVSGAAIASLGSFLKSTWEIFWCAMGDDPK